MKILLEKQHLITAQESGFLKDRQTVNDLWDKLAQICEVTQSINVKDSKEEDTYQLPSLRGNLQTMPFSSILSSKILTIVYARNEKSTAMNIMEQIISQNKTVKPQLIENPTDFVDIETKIASSTALVVLLTANAFKQPQLEFSMLCAKRYFPVISQVILVHDATSCPFPGYDEQPPSVMEFFSEKAITYLPCYAKEGGKEILQKFDQEMTALESSFNNKLSAASSLFSRIAKQSELPEAQEIPVDRFQRAFATICNDLEPDTLKKFTYNNTIDENEFCKLIVQNEEALTKYLEYKVEETKENLWTRVFLSHKRSTGQGIAGRLYEGLKKDYSVFIDSEAKFKIHNLKQLVSQTEVFVFILTAGILQSRWCREELESAIENNKQIIIVRELSFQLPDILPNEWRNSLGELLKRKTELIWMAEYNSACISALKEMIGDSDGYFMDQKLYLDSHPNIDTSITGLCGKWVTDSFVQRLVQNKPNLQHIELISCSNITNKTVVQLAQCKLQKLTLAGNSNIGDSGIMELAKSNVQLQYLDLTNSSVSETGIIALAESKMPLQYLNLSHCWNITDEGIMALAQHHVPLQHLDLEGCSITDDAIIELAKQNVPLKQLNLKGCIDITDSAIIALKRIPLQYLDLSNCRNITNAAIIELAKYVPLQHLILANCQDVTDSAIIELAKHNIPLQHLDLKNCVNVTDTAIIELAKHNIPLQNLVLEGCGITDAAIIELAQHKIPLQHLVLSGCKNVTETAIIKLVESSVPIRNLDISGTSIRESAGPYLAKLPLEELYVESAEKFSSYFPEPGPSITERHTE